MSRCVASVASGALRVHRGARCVASATQGSGSAAAFKEANRDAPPHLAPPHSPLPSPPAPERQSKPPGCVTAWEMGSGIRAVDNAAPQQRAHAPRIRMRGALSLPEIEAEIEADPHLAAEFDEIEDLLDGRAQARYSLLHREACSRGYAQYVDPATGYNVFTALRLQERPCCGNRCRHCPYEHVNVPETARRRAR